MNANLFSLFQQRLPALEKAFLTTPDGRTLSYGAMLDGSARVSRLLGRLGVSPGDRVAAQVDKSIESIILYLACIRVGAVFQPLNPAYQRQELAHLLGDARPRVVVASPEAEPLIRELARPSAVEHVIGLNADGTGELMEEANLEPPDFETASREPDDLAAILYTSGTTGLAKGAMLTHANLTAGVTVLHTAWGFEPGDVLLHILPTYHFHGLFVAIHSALWNGSSVWFEPRFDALRAISLLPESTVCMGVPTHYVRMLAEAGLDAHACRNMRLFISGSAPLLPDTFKTFQRRTGHTILERYGMTEGGMFISNPYQGERRCGSVGFPLQGVSVRIVDDEGRPVSRETTGSIQVKGANVFHGYWNLPDKTREEHTADGYFKTGDLGRADADGYISIVGRSKDLIISGGLNVYPKEIEDYLDSLSGVEESAVIGLPDPDFGEVVAAVVVRDRKASSHIDEAELIGCVKKSLAGFKVPRRVYFVDELPRNAMGKVQKANLRAAYTPMRTD